MRDLFTAVALGARATVVATSITEQDASSVTSVEPRDSDRVAVSLRSGLLRLPKPGVKIGMVATGGIARAISAELVGFSGPVVFDPVLRASSGGLLYRGERDDVLALARRATLVTPNLDEAGWLLDRRVATLDEARAAARAWVALGIPAVLIKGGHLEGEAADVLLDDDGERVFRGARLPGPSPRGTGCALATAITVGLVRGRDLSSCIADAKAWLAAKIAGATRVGDEWHL